MIHDEICSFEVSKLAKEKGFNSKCYFYYQKGELQTDKCFNRYNKGVDSICSAPTQSLLQRWLREAKGIDIEITPEPTKETESKRIYMWSTYCDCDGDYYDAHSCDEEYSTYELALEDALKYALENLI